MSINKKWGPVIESVYNFKLVKKLASQYAEHHSMIENTINSLSSLPTSIKAFSKINILDIDVEFILKGYKSISFDIDIENVEMVVSSPELIKKKEAILINKLTSYINEEILRHKTLKMHTLVNSISILSENGKAKMYLISNIDFE